MLFQLQLRRFNKFKFKLDKPREFASRECRHKGANAFESKSLTNARVRDFQIKAVPFTANPAIYSEFGLCAICDILDINVKYYILIGIPDIKSSRWILLFYLRQGTSFEICFLGRCYQEARIAESV